VGGIRVWVSKAKSTIGFRIKNAKQKLYIAQAYTPKLTNSQLLLQQALYENMLQHKLTRERTPNKLLKKMVKFSKKLKNKKRINIRRKRNLGYNKIPKGKKNT